jgi:hypothetical protein
MKLCLQVSNDILNTSKSNDSLNTNRVEGVIKSQMALATTLKND